MERSLSTSTQIRLSTPSIEEAILSDVDIFGRDKFGSQIINLIKICSESMVLLLDEPWGAGKTVFSKRLENRIASKKEEIDCVYFDAFENDYEKDSFIALASEILLLEQKPELKKEFYEKAKAVAKVTAKTIAKGTVRAFTANVINSQALDEANKEIADQIGDVVETEWDKVVDDRLNNFANNKHIFSEFRETLSRIASDKPLLIIVDELDRCKPTYALQFLETVKHFFNVKNVHFLIVTNLNALSATVEHQYGKIGGYEYLQKFYSLRLEFPKPQKSELKIQIGRFINDILSDLENSGKTEELYQFLESRFIVHEYSLRGLEKLYTMIKLAFMSSAKRDTILIPILAVLVDMKLFAPDFYTKAKLGTLTYKEICERYNFHVDVNPMTNSRDIYAITWRFLLENPSGDAWNDVWSSFEKQWILTADDDGIKYPSDVISHTISEVIEFLPA